jgi:MerR family mercuric resistance operon transcriptional regulator
MQTPLTIAALAKIANVGVETVRYYERRGLIQRPARKVGAYRTYDSNDASRIRFIKRAQELGFTLEEIRELLALEDGTDRRSIRRIASARLLQIRTRIADLERISAVLTQLLHKCEDEKTPQCPIIAAFTARETGSAPIRKRSAGSS